MANLYPKPKPDLGMKFDESQAAPAAGASHRIINWIKWLAPHWDVEITDGNPSGAAYTLSIETNIDGFFEFPLNLNDWIIQSSPSVRVLSTAQVLEEYDVR